MPTIIKRLFVVCSFICVNSICAAAQATTSTIPLTFTGELRTRTEYDHPATTTADVFTYLRTRLGIRVDPASNVRVYVQLQDSRVMGAEGGTASTAIAANIFELHQGYAEIGTLWDKNRFTLRAGRQEILLANERLVGVNNWGNIGRSFDGARATLAPDGAKAGSEPWSISAFASSVEERGRRFGNTTTSGSVPRNPDRWMAGIFGTRAIGENNLLEVTALYDGGAHDRSYDRENRATLDARLTARRVGVLRFELEGAVQGGTQHFVSSSTSPVVEQNVSAWLVGARVGTATTAKRQSTIAVGVDVLSGDSAPTDKSYHAFGTMFASNHSLYGTMDVIGDPATTTRDRGLTDAMVTGTWVMTSTASLKGEFHNFDMNAGTDRHLGWELDVFAPFKIGSAAAIDVGAAVFHLGAGAPAVALGPASAFRRFGYLQLRAFF